MNDVMRLVEAKSNSQVGKDDDADRQPYSTVAIWELPLGMVYLLVKNVYSIIKYELSTKQQEDVKS